MLTTIATHKASGTLMVRLGLALTVLASLIGFAAVSASGETWWPVGDGMEKEVYALAFDDAGRLYAGGNFTTAGGAIANHIAQWDGSAWAPLGSGMNAEIYALAVDGFGNLYAGGSFTQAGNVAASRIAKWDGTTWTALGGGMNAEVYALAISTSGELVAGGTFTSAGGNAANRIAKWDGSAWSEVGGGTSGRVNALAFDPLGNLYAGGSFTSPAGRIAKWDGTAWSALGSGLSNTARALALDGNGNLYAGGSFASASGASASRIAHWDGSAWSVLGSGMNSDVYSLAISARGELIAGGDFATAGGATVNFVAKWDGTGWSPLESGMNESVRALAIDSIGTIYAGGLFTSAGSVPANHIAAWSSLPPGPLPTPTGLPPNSIVPVSNNPQVCQGESTTVSINLTDVTDLFGYQFIVHYDPSLVDASGAFTNTFFDTRTNAIIPPDWNAVCGSGACRFAASLMEPAAPVNGSGTVAQIRLNSKSSGTFDLTISEDILTDRNSRPIQHTTHSLHFGDCSFASVSGTVSLQGRTTPIDAGQVRLSDLGGTFGTLISSLDPVTGAFSFNRVRLLPGGSNYQLEASHSLYLGKRMTYALNMPEAFSVPQTTLMGGDANNDGLIDIGDLACIGGAFGGAPVACGTTGSSDINADGVVNILDLVLAGGNYGLTGPGAW
jgi:Rax2 C-terminal beta propeller domain